MRPLHLPLLLLTLCLAACSSTPSKQYVAPEDPDVQACISSCATVRTQCRARAQDIYRVCKANYDQEMRRFNYCRQTGNKACLQPARCPAPDTRYCTSTYDGCYQTCGGEIVREKKGS